MNIRFVSSLTPDDEDRLAPGVLQAIALLLDQLPLAYTMRIETAGGRIFQHAHAGHDDSTDDTPLAPETPAERVRRGIVVG